MRKLIHGENDPNRLYKTQHQETNDEKYEEDWEFGEKDWKDLPYMYLKLQIETRSTIRKVKSGLRSLLFAISQFLSWFL
jgi:hypothetical protein